MVMVCYYFVDYYVGSLYWFYFIDCFCVWLVGYFVEFEYQCYMWYFDWCWSDCDFFCFYWYLYLVGEW